MTPRSHSPIPRRVTGAPAPASAAQRRLWILHQMNPLSAGSNRPVALRLEGPLNADVLARAVGEIVRRHEVLRTVFAEVGGEPVQQVLPPDRFDMPLVQLGGLAENSRMPEALRIASEEAKRPFDLATGPLLRGLLLSLGPGDHVLLLLMHHVVFDGWSEGLLVRELAALYAAYVAGAESPLAEPCVQYSDFAAWQRHRLDGGALEEHLSYWRSCLEPLPPSLALPTDFPPSMALTARGAEVRLALGRELTERLRTWCRRERITPFMALLSAFQAVLGRQASQEQFLVGVPVAGRTRAEIEELLGCFMNVVVMRADLSRGCSFRRLVQRTREQTLESYARQELPLERLVEALQPERQRHRWPLFDVMFNMRNMPRAAPVLADGLRIAPFEFERATIEGLSLYLQVEDGEDGFHCNLSYATELFRDSTIQRLAEQLRAFLSAALETPDLPVTLIPLLTEDRRRELVEAWNATAVHDPDPVGVHELAAAQARRTPNAVAVIAGEETLTHGELDRRANQLAHYLRGLGVGPETVVAVFMARSPELVVAILGTLKAGAAYLPLDPDAAPERTRIMLADAGAQVLLTRDRIAEALASGSAHVVALDAITDAVEAQPTAPPSGLCDSDHLAYVMFTSGSTGRPKGVMVTHGALRNHLRWRVAHFDYGPRDRVLHSAALGFDDAIWETLTPLISGGSMVLAGPGEHLDASRLVHLISEQRATVACFVPAVLSAVLDQPGFEACTTLRLVATGGEALTVALQDRFHSRTAIDLFNGYGPAETTVASSFWKCDRAQNVVTMPIGRPIANTRMYLLDDHLQPVPVGVLGELYIGGAGVARGYRHRPGATADSFVPDPFGPPGGRLYRTRDLARYRPDGALEFVGRRDQQVKIRGNRVELGEIEAVLRQHPAVEDAAVSKDLIAYVVATDGPPRWPELRAFLRQRLPQHMVPAGFVSLAALPRTSSGKVHRAALPADSIPEPEVAYQPPHTSVQLRLSEIWSALLGLERVGVDDDFFALGGHSLLATQLIVRIRAAFGVELSLRSVFEAPTLGGLATLIEAAGAGSDAAHPELDDDGDGDDERFVFPATFVQRSLWLLDQLDPDSSAYVMAQAFHLRGPLDPAALRSALQDVVARHEALRTSFTSADGVPMQVIVSRQAVAFTFTDLSLSPETGRLDLARRLVAEDAATRFDLARGPLFRARLLRLGPEEHVLAMALHHIIGDGWSLSVLTRELESCYRARAAGEVPELPDLPIQYADYAVWQHEWLQGDVLARELAYWRDQLAGAPPVLRLPFDRPRPPAQSFRGARRTLALEAGLTEALRALSRAESATLFMTLLSAFGLLLGRHSGQRDLVVGTPIAGRTRTEFERLIGCFVNTLALRLDLGAEPSFRGLLRRVREVALGAYAHQELPFERLVEELRPDRTLQHNSVFQVLFQLANIPPRDLRLPPLEAEPLRFERFTAKFDLSVAVHEQEDGLRCECSYNTDLFDGETIACFLQQYRALLEQIVTAPDRSIEEYSLLTAEARAVLPDPRERLEAPRYQTLPEAFAARVSDAPAAVAVEQDGRTWSYAELAAAADRIGAALRCRGVGRGDRVAVTGQRSFGLVASLLGTLGSGAVMVPLDPRLPERRRRLMVREVSASVILEAVPASDQAPGDSDRLPVDAATGEVLAQARGVDDSPDLAPAPNPDDPAYVFFTSGTTGTPKMVLGVHRALGHFLAWERALLGAGPGDRVGLLSNLSFDVMLRDLFLPLAGGATAVLPPAELSPKQTLGWLAAARITVLHAVPSIANFWLESAGDGGPALSLRYVLFAGEPLTDVVVRRWREVVSRQCGIVNLYGPTESTMVKSCYRVPEEPAPGIQPVGRPLPQTQLLVLGPRDRLCGIGEPGEIVFRSPFLTLGYLTPQGAEERAFASNPFGDDPADRIYRTGDLGRYRPDGTAVWLGRLDDQIKLFGVRVEPDEVAAVLARHPQVRSCAVVASPADGSPAGLVAYVVPADRVGASDLRTWLAERLPSAMMPGRFVFLSRLPLSANGKVDRAALPARGDVDETPSESSGAPRTPLERELVAIWREVLQVEQLGIHDSFFTFGGHSLLATQVVARIRTRFGLDLSPRVMFDAPTVAGVADAIMALKRGSKS